MTKHFDLIGQWNAAHADKLSTVIGWYTRSADRTHDFQDTKYIDTPEAQGLFELNVKSTLC